MVESHLGAWSLLPILVTLIAAFKSRSAPFALFLGCVVGAVMTGVDPARGFNDLARRALGNSDFIWLCLIICFIGILFELFKDAGVLKAFADKVARFGSSRRRVKTSTWLMGLVIIDDYFGPLMRGAIMRPIADKVRISREKLSYILDATASPVCILFPFGAWGTYITSLILAQRGPDIGREEALGIFIAALPYNFYAILIVLFTLALCLKLLPDFGPMRRAEERALTTGKVVRDGAMPLTGAQADEMSESRHERVYLFYDLAVPVAILFAIGIGGYFVAGTPYVAEAFFGAVTYLSLSLLIKRQITSVEELTVIAMKGIKGAMPALIIIALAYCLNAVTKELGASDFVVGLARGHLSPELLVAASFLLTAVISFCTGTSWGSYALMVPFALPLAYSFNGNVVDPLVYKTIAAIAGGGVFGDHASPVSDTTVLSSAGAGSDHIDHVLTQLPYALMIGSITIVLYLIV